MHKLKPVECGKTTYVHLGRREVGPVRFSTGWLAAWAGGRHQLELIFSLGGIWRCQRIPQARWSVEFHVLPKSDDATSKMDPFGRSAKRWGCSDLCEAVLG